VNRVANTAPDDEFLATACRALRGKGGSALDALGWWDLLPRLADDQDARAAVFAVFRAQGRELVDSPALGGLLAQPWVERAGLEPGAAVAAVLRRSRRRGPVWVVVGDVEADLVLFDDPNEGCHLVERDAIAWHRVDVAGRATVHEVTVDLSARRAASVDTGPDRERRRGRSTLLGRVAAAAEMLGAAEAAVALAVEHAAHREQFGRPIGTFQAVRHLLAWAETDCTAVDGTVREALVVLDDPPPHFGEVVKALAGRNGRRACQRSLQVLGGIGFTAEHSHHHHYSRVLLLDALLGSSAELTSGLGAWLRTTLADPGYPASILHGAA
jgi:hypothetical protein